MARPMPRIDCQSAQVVGRNRLQLLLFRLAGPQQYGINVFKVREVVPCPSLIQVPMSHAAVCGVATLRGRAVPVIDLSLAIGLMPGTTAGAYVVLTEYSRSVQGFLVAGVERIVDLAWTEVLPPQDIVADGYLTGIADVGGAMIELIDVEKVLAEVVARDVELSAAALPATPDITAQRRVLVVDDSALARHQIQATLAQLGMAHVSATNGREALSMLSAWAADGCLDEQVDLVVSDVEMPVMDGYTLTTEIRRAEALRHLPVILHTSISGLFNADLVARAGADQFIAKFDPDALAHGVLLGLASSPRRQS